MTQGIPQGSILGPLLFKRFMNDLPLHVESELDMYTDDSPLCATGKTIEDLDLKLNNDMDCVNYWCNDNHMVGNGDQTKATYQKESKLTKKNSPFFSTTLNWRMWILKSFWMSKLTSTSHGKTMLNKTAKTISRNLALFRWIKRYLTHQTRITFYKAYIQPHIDYSNTIGGQSTHIPRIHILQKMALRMIMDVPKLIHPFWSMWSDAYTNSCKI